MQMEDDVFGFGDDPVASSEAGAGGDPPTHATSEISTNNSVDTTPPQPIPEIPVTNGVRP